MSEERLSELRHEAARDNGLGEVSSWDAIAEIDRARAAEAELRGEIDALEAKLKGSNAALAEAMSALLDVSRACTDLRDWAKARVR